MRRIGYLRVSTEEQRPDRQIEGLKALCDELHIETLSAVSRKRPVYDRIKKRLESGDELVIWDLDRAYRSARDALNELDALQRRGVNFVIANFKLDTTTPEGYYVYTIISANCKGRQGALHWAGQWARQSRICDYIDHRTDMGAACSFSPNGVTRS